MKLKLGKIVKFKKAKAPNNNKIIGKYVVVEPLNIKKHSKDLFKNYQTDSQNLNWKYLSYGPFKSLNSFKKWLNNFCINYDPFFYAVYSKRHKQFTGMLSYLDIQRDHGSIEIGHINYSTLLQNSVEGTETMYLMMKNAFENLDWINKNNKKNIKFLYRKLDQNSWQYCNKGFFNFKNYIPKIISAFN